MENFDGGSRQVLGPNGTAAIWATYPQPFASVWTGLGDQVRGHIGMHGQGVTSLMFQTELFPERFVQDFLSVQFSHLTLSTISL